MEKKYFYGVYTQDEYAFIAYPSIKIKTKKKNLNVSCSAKPKLENYSLLKKVFVKQIV